MADEVSDVGQDIVDTVTDPQVIITTAIVFLATGYFNPLEGGGFNYAAATTAGTIYIGGAAASRALAPDLNALGGFSADSLNQRGKNIQFKSPIAARQIVYGQARVSGPILWIDTKAGSNNNVLQMIIAINGRESEHVLAHYGNDDLIRDYGSPTSQDANQWPVAGNNEFASRFLNAESTSQYHDYMDVQIHNGGADAVTVNINYPKPQLANFNFQQNATIDGVNINAQDWKYEGITYAYIEMTYDATVYKEGVPAHTFEVKGAQLFDPRDDRTRWSNNPALVIRDYLTNTIYGLNVPDSAIDDASFIAAANTCEETVDGENRYEINGVVDTSRAPKAIIEDMLTACVGALIFTGGKYRLLVGDYQTPTKTITKDMIVSPISISTKNPARNQVNLVKGTFKDKDQDYLTTDFTPISDSVYFFEDNAEPSFIDLTLPFTTSKSMAERIALITLRQLRNEKTLSMSLNLEGFDIDVGDTVYFSDDRIGFDQATFQCISWELTQDGKIPRVNIALRETTPSLFDTTTDIEPITRNAKDYATYNSSLDTYLVSDLDLETIFGAYWTQDIRKEFLIPSDVTVYSSRVTDTSWSSSDTLDNYTAAVKDRASACIKMPANLAGELTLRNRGLLKARGGYGGYAYSSFNSYFLNYAAEGAKGGDVFWWETASSDNRPSNPGTVLIVNDGTILAGGGGMGYRHNNSVTLSGIAQGATGAGSDAIENLVAFRTTIGPFQGTYYRGGAGSLFGGDGERAETSSDGLNWSEIGPQADNNGELIRVDSNEFEDTGFNSINYIQDADQKTRIKINNKGTITAGTHNAFSTITDLFVE